VKNRVADYLPLSWLRGPYKEGNPQRSVEATLKELAAPVEQFVAKNPGASLAIALATGVAIAWWLKRK
jgi:ElaB/YqjD/DUF883 family membrane-anchored ribosome-binding protein